MRKIGKARRDKRERQLACSMVALTADCIGQMLDAWAEFHDGRGCAVEAESFRRAANFAKTEGLDLAAELAEWGQ